MPPLPSTVSNPEGYVFPTCDGCGVTLAKGSDRVYMLLRGKGEYEADEKKLYCRTCAPVIRREHPDAVG